MNKFKLFFANIFNTFADKQLKDKKDLIIELLLKDNTTAEIIYIFNELEAETCKTLAKRQQENKTESQQLKDFLKN